MIRIPPRRAKEIKSGDKRRIQKAYATKSRTRKHPPEKITPMKKRELMVSGEGI
jgi:hypothetical protein